MSASVIRLVAALLILLALDFLETLETPLWLFTSSASDYPSSKSILHMNCAKTGLWSDKLTKLFES